MRNSVWGTGIVASLAAVIGLGVWLWPRRESAELREVKQLQAEMQQTMFAPPAENSDLSPEQRRAKFDQLREKMESLPEADRKQAEKAMREGRTKQMEQKLATFFALRPEEQSAALDKDIDEQEARRKAWGGGGPFGPPPGGPPPGGGGPPPGAPGANSEPGTAGANGDGRPGNRPFGPPRFGQNMSAEERKRMQRDMLDSTSPQFRAQMSEYIKKIQARRQERGLPSFGPRT